MNVNHQRKSLPCPHLACRRSGLCGTKHGGCLLTFGLGQVVLWRCYWRSGCGCGRGKPKQGLDATGLGTAMVGIEKHNRPALTLIELLVLMAIIGILTALLLSAIQ